MFLHDGILNASPDIKCVLDCAIVKEAKDANL